MPGKAGTTWTRGKDRTGERFGRLVVVARTDKRSRTGGSVVWSCRCDCGGIKEVPIKYLVGGNTTSCGCYRQEIRAEIGKKLRLDLTGKRYGRFTVIQECEESEHGSFWLCQCDCGAVRTVKGAYLNSGRAVACGCLNLEIRRCEETVRISIPKPPRTALVRSRTPLWSNATAIKQFYEARPAGCDVDHIIPLRGKLASGLHVLENLQYLPRRKNLSKKNNFEPSFT